MSLPRIDLGYKNFINAESIFAIINIKSRPSERLLSIGKSHNKMIDVTNGKAAKCFVIADNWDMYKISKNPRTVRVAYYENIVELNKKDTFRLIEPMIELGFDNYVMPSKIDSVLSVEMRTIKKILQEKKDNNLFIDCTHGKKTRSIILLKNSYIIMSAVESVAIEKRRSRNINMMICAKNNLAINDEELTDYELDSPLGNNNVVD